MFSKSHFIHAKACLNLFSLSPEHKNFVPINEQVLRIERECYLYKEPNLSIVRNSKNSTHRTHQHYG